MLECDKKHMLLWVEALESGQYDQTTGYLHVIEPNGDAATIGWCCMGVACDVAIREGAPIHRFEGDWTERFDDLDSYPPGRLHRWLGVDPTDDGDIIVADSDPDDWDDSPGQAPVRASVANDTRRWTFGEIAASLRGTYGLPPREG